MTDARIIRLISRHFKVFPTAAARQLFDGYVTQLIWKIFRGDTRVTATWGLSKKGRKASLLKNPAYAIALIVSFLSEVI